MFPRVYETKGEGVKASVNQKFTLSLVVISMLLLTLENKVQAEMLQPSVYREEAIYQVMQKIVNLQMI